MTYPKRIKIWLHNPDWNDPVKTSIATKSARSLFGGTTSAKAYFYATYLQTDNSHVVYFARPRAFANAWSKITGMRPAVTAPLELDYTKGSGGFVDTFNRCHTDRDVRIKVNRLVDIVSIIISKTSPMLLAESTK